MGESIVVFGAGGVGLNIIQASSLLSASKIIAVDLFDNRLELAKYFGATHTINSVKSDAEALIHQALGDQPLDIFVDNTGSPPIIEMGDSLVEPSNGRVVLVGVPRTGKTVNINTLPLHFGKSLVGSHGGESQPSIDIPRYLRLHQKGSLNIDRIVSSRFRLESINEALDSMRSGVSAGLSLIHI